MQVEKESKSVGLEKEDALNQARWRVGAGEIAVEWGKSGQPRLRGETQIKIELMMIKYFIRKKDS